MSAKLSDLTIGQRLAALIAHAPQRVVFTTSFGLEDQALTHIIAEQGSPVHFATLDTGRLFPQTYELWAETEARYGIKIMSYAPDQSNIEHYVAKHGINGFHHSVEARHACCDVRKLQPLARALKGASLWVTGLRGEQSAHRARTPFAKWDEERGLIKANPLADWTRQQLVDFIALENVPYNSLHDAGFASIGCAPCTRAIKIGETERAGRWWWENDARRECGLHVSASETEASS